MKIINPTDNEISIQFKGIVYTIPARGSISQVKEEVATYWKTMIHEFILVSEDDIIEKEPICEVKEEVVEVKKSVTKSNK